MAARNKPQRTNTKVKDIIFLAIQFLILFLFVVTPNFSTFLFPKFIFWIGLAVSTIGISLIIIASITLGNSLSPYPTPSPRNKLITHGIFAYSRHPIYTGILILLLGLCLITGGVSRFILLIAAIILFHKKAAYEENQLMKIYPEYKMYKNKTGKFLPGL